MSTNNCMETTKSCDHYSRKCRLVSPCCNKVYSCRFCHDEKADHKLIRSDVKIIECLQCGKRQQVSSKCESCLITFGKYFCATCCLFDDNDKGQYHCDGCGICRVGGREFFFHCDKCDVCLNKSLKGSHQCIEKSSRNNCAICLEDLHTSTIGAHVPGCGHLLHSTCFTEFIKSGGYSCPTCNKCLLDMSGVWRRLDTEIAQTPMPDEYENFEVQILCRDCQKHSKVKFHVVGLKCSECGSYNTSRDDDPNEPLNPVIFDGNLVENEVEYIDGSEEEDFTAEVNDDEDGQDDEDVQDDEHVQENDHRHVVDIADDNISIQSDFSLD